MSAADRPHRPAGTAGRRAGQASANESAGGPAVPPRAPDPADDAIWLASAGHQILQLRQAAEARRTEVLAAARADRLDLSEATFSILVDQGFPLTIPFEATPGDVLAYLEAVRPAAVPPPRSWRWRRLVQALERLRAQGNVAPTQAALAEAMMPPITDRTLRGWLAVEPGLRDLLPRAPRPRRRLPEPRRFST